MKEILTKLEASKHGLIKGKESYLPEGFEMDGEIASYRFWLMMKLRNPNDPVIIKHHDWYIADFRRRLLAAHPDKLVAEKSVVKLTKSAYYTIPSSFWECLESHMTQA